MKHIIQKVLVAVPEFFPIFFDIKANTELGYRNYATLKKTTHFFIVKTNKHSYANIMC